MLLDELKAAIRIRHYSRRTEEAYSGWIRRFILFNGKRIIEASFGMIHLLRIQCDAPQDFHIRLRVDPR